MKRQARRRLIGAIALTTAVVVILPMVLEREPAPSTQDIELRIPDKDHAGEFTPKVGMPAASAVAEPQAASAVVIAPPLDAKPVAAAVKPKVEAPVSAAAEAKPHVALKPKAEPQPKSAAKPVTKPAEKFAVPHSGFVVQVGAFANAEAAKHLQDKLAKQGYHAYTEKTGNIIRVRVGSYSTHEAADKIRLKLEAQGLQPNVVNLN